MTSLWSGRSRLWRERPARGCVCTPGGVSKQYGLENLVKGFRKADLPDARLEIYGPGDYVQELSQIAAEDSRIFYGGMLLNAEIVEREMAATLLVNPRPTGEEYVKYSFLQDHGVYVHGNAGADHGSAGNAQGISPLRVPVGGGNR